MSARLLLSVLTFAMPSIVCAATLTSTADLTGPYLVTNAGKVANLPSSVDVKIDYETTFGKLVVTDWKSRQECTKYGPSPNGEPELAECEKWATVWGPRVQLENVVSTVKWKLGDLSGGVNATDTVDLTKCVLDYEQVEITQKTKPTSELPDLVLKRDCLGYTYVGQTSTAVSSVLSNADVQVELKFGNFIRFDLSNDLVITRGVADPIDTEILAQNVSYDPSYTQLIFDPTLTRQGRTIRLVNYPVVVYFR